MTTKELENLAFELFAEVHTHLGHAGSWLTRDAFESNPPRKAAWIEIARALDERFFPGGRWLDDCALALYQRVHERLNDGLVVSDIFHSVAEVRRAWCEIARVFDERLRASSSGARVLVAGDGERWYVRRVASVTHDLERDEKVYRCDAHLGGPFDDGAEALACAKAAMVGK